MKRTGYYLFAFVFYIFRLFLKPSKNKIFCIMTHDASKGSSVGVVVEALKKKKDKYRFYYMKKSDRESVQGCKIAGIFSLFIKKPYQMASSSVILMDNIFLPMAFMKFRSNVKVVQLWHGTGTIKKFGQDANKGKLKELENKANQSITHLIVNSDEIKKQYAQAFGIREDRVYVWGLPRTDELFDVNIKERKKQKFYHQFPELKNKKLVLYAPTFRDQQVENPDLCLSFDKIMEETAENVVFLIKMHPFVAAKFKLNNAYSERVKNVSFYEDINTLLFVSDILITDYSSIIYEYCLLNKPMIFYAYDLEDFGNHGRGFYKPYKNFVPGPVVSTTEEIVNLMNQGLFDMERIKLFKKMNYKYEDGKSMDRLLDNIL